MLRQSIPHGILMLLSFKHTTTKALNVQNHYEDISRFDEIQNNH